MCTCTHTHTQTKPSKQMRKKSSSEISMYSSRKAKHRKLLPYTIFMSVSDVKKEEKKNYHRNRSITVTDQIHGRLYFYQSAASKTLLLSPYKAHTHKHTRMNGHTHTCMHTYPHSLCCVVCVCARMRVS